MEILRPEITPHFQPIATKFVPDVLRESAANSFVARNAGRAKAF